jgi:hypothetical protein
MEVEIVECLFFLLKFGWLNSIHFCFSTLEKFILYYKKQIDKIDYNNMLLSNIGKSSLQCNKT